MPPLHRFLQQDHVAVGRQLDGRLGSWLGTRVTVEVDAPDLALGRSGCGEGAAEGGGGGRLGPASSTSAGGASGAAVSVRSSSS